MTKPAPLLDTNIIIDVLNGNKLARDYLKSLPVLKVSSISVFEVVAGCTGERQKQLPIAREIFEVCEVIELSQLAAEHAAIEFTKSPQKNKILDLLIAGTAATNELEVATRNPKDFKSVKAFEPYNL